MLSDRRVRFAVWVLFVALLLARIHAAEDVVVMTSGAFTTAYLSLSEAYAKVTGDRFITATTSMGVGRESIPSRLAAGEAVDIVIVAADALEKLIADGRVVRGSRVDLARSSIALAVRRGATRPDISSVDALKRTFLSAASVAISASVSGDYVSRELYPRLGIATEMRGKTHRIARERVGEVVARGDAELGVQQLSELKAVSGVDIVGLLPGDTQRVTIFSAGIATSAHHVAAARAFLAFLVSDNARDAIERAGLEPLRGRSN